MSRRVSLLDWAAAGCTDMNGQEVEALRFCLARTRRLAWTEGRPRILDENASGVSVRKRRLDNAKRDSGEAKGPLREKREKRNVGGGGL